MAALLRVVVAAAGKVSLSVQWSNCTPQKSSSALKTFFSKKKNIKSFDRGISNKPLVNHWCVCKLMVTVLYTVNNFDNSKSRRKNASLSFECSSSRDLIRFESDFFVIVYSLVVLIEAIK